MKHVMRRIGRCVRAAAVLPAVVGCTDRVVTPAVAAPGIDASTVVDNPHNVLSAVVLARLRLADSVVVRYGIAGQTRGVVSAAVVPVADSALVPVLGLQPETAYELQVVAYGGGQSAAGELLSFTTGSLPHDIPEYVAAGSDPSAGYVAFAAGMYGLVIDNSGRVVWYHRFANGAGLNFQAQPTGRWVARPQPAEPGRTVRLLEINPLGTITRELGCIGGLNARFHDLLARPDGSYWIMCDETRTLDLSVVGGLADARVTGTVVQHVSDQGSLLFEWSPFDHFAITDIDPADLAGATVNWTHGNALDIDVDGNLLVSFRNLSEITKVDTRSGTVLWRLGGPRNDFTFEDASVPVFSRQHGLRVTGSGELLLLDNLGSQAGTTARRYVYDDRARTARLSKIYGSQPPVTAQLGGTTQDLPGGRTLVSFGSASRVEEYDADGNVVWRIEGEAGYVFRAQRILSLYHPGVGLPR